MQSSVAEEMTDVRLATSLAQAKSYEHTITMATSLFTVQRGLWHILLPFYSENMDEKYPTYQAKDSQAIPLCFMSKNGFKMNCIFCNSLWSIFTKLFTALLCHMSFIKSVIGQSWSFIVISKVYHANKIFRKYMDSIITFTTTEMSCQQSIRQPPHQVGKGSTTCPNL